jgi:hypothetical protein
LPKSSSIFATDVAATIVIASKRLAARRYLSSSQAREAHQSGAFSGCFRAEITRLAHYSGAMRETDADRFLGLAEECLKEAEKAITPLDKEAWLKLAEEWMQLARAAKERR